MPSNAPLGSVSIQVTYNGASNYSSTTVAAASFGIFAANSAGSGPGIVQNADSQGVVTNSLTKPARRGQAIVIWGTGLGAVANDAQPPPVGDLPTPIEVYVGGKLAPTQYKGRTPCCSGLDQIVVNVPNDAPLGCYVPVQVRVNGSVVSNAVTMAISDTNSCSDPHNPASPFLRTAGKNAVMLLGRFNIREDIGFATPRDFVDDQFSAYFERTSGGEFAFDPLLSLPPIGTCSNFTRVGGAASPSSIPFAFDPGTLLDAGPSLSVQAATVSRGVNPKLYTAKLGASDTAASPLILNPARTITVTSSGGPDVGAVNFTVPAPPAFDFNNRAGLDFVNRANPLSLSWTGVAGTVVIVGVNFDRPRNATALFVCAASASAGIFTVPSYVLQTVPASRPVYRQSNGYIMVGSIPTATTTISASGLDRGVAMTASFAAKSVVFR
jgi:hypothetical protein